MQNWNSAVNFPQLVNLVFLFSIHNECKPMDKIICRSQWLQTLVLLSAHMFLNCFSRWLYILNVLTLSRASGDLLVTPSTYSVIYSEKHALYLSKFWSRVWSVPGSLFRLPLIAKRCAGDKDGPELSFLADLVQKMKIVS